MAWQEQAAGSEGVRRVTRVPSVSQEYPIAQANRLASRFDLPAPLEALEFPDKGNINQHTYLVIAGRAGGEVEYLIQRINQQVFTRPWSVMRAMIACIEEQKQSLAKGALRPGETWQPVTLVPTRDGKPYLETNDRRGYGCWRLMVKIPDSRTFKSLSQISDSAERFRIAEQAGSGLAMYAGFTSGMDTSSLENPLPGYRDTGNYYSQLLSVLAGCRTAEAAERYLPLDPVVRQSTELHFLLHVPEDESRRRTGDRELRPFIDLALNEQEFALTLQRDLDENRIRRLAIHGDTKLDNFLFDTRSGRVKALVDLDTIMPHTWLVDWGDMVRSLVNVAGEKEPDMSKVAVDAGIFDALARGFLGSARDVRASELDRMVDAVQIIALELGIRFLADYLRGDSYFRLSPADPPNLNKIRAMVQLTLFRQLRAREAELRRTVEVHRRECGLAAGEEARR